MKVAGIDVHKKVLMAVVVDASKPEEKPARRRFATMPSERHRLLTWLQCRRLGFETGLGYRVASSFSAIRACHPERRLLPRRTCVPAGSIDTARRVHRSFACKKRRLQDDK